MNSFGLAMGGVFVVGLSLFACSSTGTSSGQGGSASGGGTSGSGGTNGNSGTSGSGGGGGSANGVNSSTPAVNPTGSKPGEGCRASADCLYHYCDCTNNSVVNAQVCLDGVCKGADVACPGSCRDFGTTWAGTAGMEKPRSPSGSSGSGAACVNYVECAEYACTCSDGVTIRDQACLSGQCANASTGCNYSCQETGHGG